MNFKLCFVGCTSNMLINLFQNVRCRSGVYCIWTKSEIARPDVLVGLIYTWFHLFRDESRSLTIEDSLIFVSQIWFWSDFSEWVSEWVSFVMGILLKKIIICNQITIFQICGCLVTFGWRNTQLKLNESIDWCKNCITKVKIFVWTGEVFVKYRLVKYYIK